MGAGHGHRGRERETQRKRERERERESETQTRATCASRSRTSCAAVGTVGKRGPGLYVGAEPLGRDLGHAANERLARSQAAIHMARLVLSTRAFAGSIGPIAPSLAVHRVAQSAEEERALLGERVPQKLLDGFGPQIIASALQHGLNRRTILLTLHEQHLQDVALPRAVGQLLHTYWSAQNGEH